MLHTPEALRLFAEHAARWRRWGRLRRNTLLRFVILCSEVGMYRDIRGMARAPGLTAKVKRRLLDVAESARQAARQTAVSMGTISQQRAALAILDEEGEDSDLNRLLPRNPNSRQVHGHESRTSPT